MGMVPSRRIANLLSKQISTLAVAREVYGHGTKPVNREFAEQANQHSSCHIERCTGMIPSRRIANLLGKQISTLAIAREVYGYDTKLKKHESAGQANSHSTGMVLSWASKSARFM